MNDQQKKASRNRKLRVEQLCSRQLLAADMTNPVNALDANNSGDVTAGDALVVMNYLRQVAEGAEGEQAGTLFPDTNGDNVVSSGDALRVINHVAIEAESVDDNGQPEVFRLDIDAGRSIKIDFAGNHVKGFVTTPQSGFLEFSGLGETLTLPIKDNLIIDVEGHGNQLIFDRADIPDDLVVRVKGHDNGIRLTRTYVGDDFIFRGGDGADAVAVDVGTLIVENLDINTRGGDDTVIVRGANVQHDVFIRTERGNDCVAGESTNVFDDAIVRLGKDNDYASFSDIFVDDVADIKADGGFDTLAVDQNTVSARKLKYGGFDQIGELKDIDNLINNLFDC